MGWINRMALIVVTLFLTITVGWTPAWSKGSNGRLSLYCHLDKDHDGKISKKEYCSGWKIKDAAEQKFKLMDDNQDGFLTEDELLITLEQLEGKVKRPSETSK